MSLLFSSFDSTRAVRIQMRVCAERELAGVPGTEMNNMKIVLAIAGVVLVCFAAFFFGFFDQPPAKPGSQMTSELPPLSQKQAKESVPGPPIELSDDGFVHLPWVKICSQSSDRCVIHSIAYTETAVPLTSIFLFLVEPEGGRKKSRLVVPAGMHLPSGVRFAVDQDSFTDVPYTSCFGFSCDANIETTRELIQRMSSGEKLVVQVTDLVGDVFKTSFPLAGFVEALDGPSIDLKTHARQERQLRWKLLKRAAEKMDKKNK